MTEKKADDKFEPLSPDGVNNALLGIEDGKRSQNKVNDRTSVTTVESPHHVLFITHDKQEDGGTLHRGILPKD